MGRRASVWHVHKPDACHGLEIVGCQVDGRAVARRAIGTSFPGFALASRNKSAADRIFCRCAPAPRSAPGRERDRFEGLDATARELDADAGNNGKRTGGEQQRMAIRRTLTHHVAADDRTGSRLVLNDKRLAEATRKFIAQRACYRISATAGRKRNNHANRSRWIRFRTRSYGQNRQCGD